LFLRVKEIINGRAQFGQRCHGHRIGLRRQCRFNISVRREQSFVQSLCGGVRQFVDFTLG